MLDGYLICQYCYPLTIIGGIIIARYTVSEFVTQNKADWEDACAQLAGGDRLAVPYVWDSIAELLTMAPRLFDAGLNYPTPWWPRRALNAVQVRRVKSRTRARV